MNEIILAYIGVGVMLGLHFPVHRDFMDSWAFSC